MTSKSPVIGKLRQASGKEKVAVLGVSITIAPKKEILQYLLENRAGAGIRESGNDRIPNRQSTPTSAMCQTGYARVVVTPNPEQLAYAQDHPWYQELLNQAEVALPDGVGVVWAIRRKTKVESLKTMTRIAGVDFMNDLLIKAAEDHLPVAFLGNQNAVSALEKVKLQYPELKGWSYEIPVLSVEDDHLSIRGDENEKESLDSLLATLTEKIITSQTSIVFVGLGAPKQELFISALNNELRMMNNDLHSSFDIRNSIFMSVGGSFDILAGKTPRAPRWLRQLQLEWLWRLGVEPWRWKRQLALIRFVWLVMRQK